MIQGRVVNGRAVVSIPFRFTNQPSIAIEFAVDTGFSDFRSVPRGAATALGLPFLYDFPASLADGTSADYPVHGAAIEWDGVVQGVRVLALGKHPLLGMAMLNGYKLEVEAIEGGLVIISKL